MAAAVDGHIDGLLQKGHGHGAEDAATAIGPHFHDAPQLPVGDPEARSALGHAHSGGAVPRHGGAPQVAEQLEVT